ncbi:transglycosylase SLT domain-containing protein [Streptomyces sp. SID12501]|uniref:Transglycosylase SLT domain-containing protein n=1 Tax=Streptomyces sp. SID12501 TaxID=2706042 RepID=A0A6B3BV80_9ACTN|nr:transglycosylase SLT domain-containing protein [Streptomyces sp. SID12501]NEC88265.1 transglycosylase SLT domain-containing protein [Streptomyces sp. SID12501]
MSKNTATPGHSRMSARTRRLAVAGAATLASAALAFTLVPGSSQTTSEAVSAAPVVFGQEQVKDVKASVTGQLAGATVKAEADAAKKKAADVAAAKKAAAKKKAAKERKAKEAASRSAKRAALKKATTKTYGNNLDGWIREALDIMGNKGIPGSYDGLYRNIMRESTGNPNAINGWDVNAQNGTPSIGLLQVIQPTFNAYHVSGTSTSIYDPVANITAAANYAADKYGSIDNVNGAY